MLRAGFAIGLLSALTLSACAKAAPQHPPPPIGAACGGAKPSPGDRGASAGARGALGDFDGVREVEAWVDMWNHFDLDGVDALFVRDARVTYFSSEKPGLIAGIDALREHHRGFGFVPGGADRGSRLWLEEVQAHTYGRVVLVTATWFFQRRGSDKAQRGPVTLVLLNDGGGCRITHAHFANDPPPKVAPAETTK
jgi:ketosteroid isomerase-like protein